VREGPIIFRANVGRGKKGWKEKSIADCSHYLRKKTASGRTPAQTGESSLVTIIMGRERRGRGRRKKEGRVQHALKK